MTGVPCNTCMALGVSCCMTLICSFHFCRFLWCGVFCTYFRTYKIRFESVCRHVLPFWLRGIRGCGCSFFTEVTNNLGCRLPVLLCEPKLAGHPIRPGWHHETLTGNLQPEELMLQVWLEMMYIATGVRTRCCCVGCPWTKDMGGLGGPSWILGQWGASWGSPRSYS